MAVQSVGSASGVAFRYGNPSFDCDGVRMRARCRQLATVVTVNGDINEMNVDRIREHARRYILAEKPFVLDLSGVTSFTAQSISLLYSVDEACFGEGVEWSLVANQAVVQALRSSGPVEDFPIVGSVAEALHHFNEGILARRRLLPLLTKTALTKTA